MKTVDHTALAIRINVILFGVLFNGCIDFSIPNSVTDSSATDTNPKTEMAASNDNTDADSDADADANADSDADTDSDTDTDSDADSDADDTTYEIDSDTDSDVTSDIHNSSDSNSDEDTARIDDDTNDSNVETVSDVPTTSTETIESSDSNVDCDSSATDTHTDSDSDSDADLDTDTDVDSDTDVDTDTDSDTDSNTDIGIAVDPAWRTGGFDSRPMVIPILNEVGGAGNITAHGSVTEPVSNTGGACNYGKTNVYYYAAINANHRPNDGLGQWNSGRVCGQCAKVMTETVTGDISTIVRIMDRCADNVCGIDIGGLPAKDVMGSLPGRYLGIWEFVPCSEGKGVSDGPVTIYVKEGASLWWSLIQIRNPPAAVQSITWISESTGESGTFQYATEAENFFSVPAAVRQATWPITITLNCDFDIHITHELIGTDLIVEEALIAL